MGKLGDESSQLTCCGKIFQGLFIIFNFIFLLIGLLLLALGIYLQVTSQTYSVITGSSYVTGAALLIACGVITFVICAIGFLGGCLKWRPLLVTFAIIISLIVLLEIITGILGFVFRDQLLRFSDTQYRDRWENAIRRYRVQGDPDFDGENNEAVDFYQKALDCCGIDQPSDWGELNGDYLNQFNNRLPESCACTNIGQGDCGLVTFTYNASNFVNTINQTAWTKGCYNVTLDFFTGNSIYVAIVSGSIGIAFGLFEITGIVVALALCCCITHARKLEQV